MNSSAVSLREVVEEAVERHRGKIGALTLADPTLLSLAAIGACWMVAFPLLMAAARRLDR